MDMKEKLLQGIKETVVLNARRANSDRYILETATDDTAIRYAHQRIYEEDAILDAFRYAFDVLEFFWADRGRVARIKLEGKVIFDIKDFGTKDEMELAKEVA